MNECWCYEEDGQMVVCASCATDELVTSMDMQPNPELLKDELDGLIIEVDGWLDRSKGISS